MFPWPSKRGQPATSTPSDARGAARDLVARADRHREQQSNLEAIACYEQSLALDPDNVYVVYWLATLHEQAGELAIAHEWCRRGLALAPDQIGLLLRLGSVAVAGFNPILALDCYEHIARLDPEVEDIDAMLADQYCLLGRLREGVAAFDRALARSPDSVKLQSNRLFVLNYTDFLGRDELFKEHLKWGARHEATARQLPPAPRAAGAPVAKLRIGYVSPDLRDHPVASFLEPLLRAHDHAAFEIHCFDTSTVAEDQVTARLKSPVDAWHKVAGESDRVLADTIRSAGIDILVDLSGHTSHHRLLTFALKPAPVQATWLGYLNTTGLRAMDYRITDAYLDPPGATERYHTESLFRLPNHSCFNPSPEAPEVNRLPAAEHGVFTFGSLNQWPKVSDAAKAVWGELLRSIANSRLIVVARGGQHPAFRDRIVADFVRFGAKPQQVQVSPALAPRRFLELFHQIDLALDPFPYGGGTTTMQSLWMGVPVVTLRGANAFSRNSVGLLCEAGLADLVADTAADYVRIAGGLAAKIDGLTTTRAGLRQSVARSPLMDESSFARNMEAAFRAMWRNHCAGRKAELSVP